MAKYGQKLKDCLTLLDRLLENIAKELQSMDFLTASPPVKSYFFSRCDISSFGFSDHVRHRIGWMLVVVASFLGASMLLRGAIDEWKRNPTGN